ncbi:DHA2 family efflux MFS transporter permease subunit [Fodinicola acaciae]|uniref:DHA2 family efflux MFS transporter permease subunit n=1 Tax=Fodinicola acaciae TaxID=2681555 RepID=UPI0013D16A31|nr:DHA2 family efflux MFS transporter permease subunit [Fodinicola acaciae]
MERLDPGLVRLALVLMLGSVAIGLDMTVVLVALPSLTTQFGATAATIQWVTTGYVLALTAVVPLSGWLVGRFGARTSWLVALAVFLAGSLLCGLAWSIDALIACRVVQGLGGGLLMPLVRTILAQAAGPARMGRAMVFVAVPGSLTPTLGPVLGGVAVGTLGWRWVFVLQVPLCLIALLLAWRTVPVNRATVSGVRLDATGLALLSSGLVALVYGLSDSGNNGFTVASVCGAVLGVGLLVGYACHALRTTTRPIIDLRLLRYRSFAASSALLFLLGGSLFGSFFLLPLYFQQARGVGTLETGFLLVPLGLGMAVSMTYAGRLIDRIGTDKPVVVCGMLITAAGLAPYVAAGPNLSLYFLAGALLVVGLGVGAVMLAAMTATYRGVPDRHTAAATSASRIAQQIGQVIGTALLAFTLQRGISTAEQTTAFHVAFGCALGLSALAFIPAMLFPQVGEKKVQQPAGAVRR